MIYLILAIISTMGKDLGDINLATLNLKENRSITSSNNTGIASDLKSMRNNQLSFLILIVVSLNCLLLPKEIKANPYKGSSEIASDSHRSINGFLRPPVFKGGSSKELIRQMEQFEGEKEPQKQEFTNLRPPQNNGINIPTATMNKNMLTTHLSETTTTWGDAFFPVDNFQKYTALFGQRIHPITKKLQFHAGLDLAAPLGSSVRAWWDGEIVNLSNKRFCGTTIKIRSGQWTHIYCHLKGYVYTDRKGIYLIDRSGGIQLKLGQTVRAGMRIGRVGMTGRTTGPHLHWGLKHKNKSIDPALVLEEMNIKVTK